MQDKDKARGAREAPQNAPQTPRSRTFTMDEYRIGRGAGFSYWPSEDPERARVRSALAIARALHRLRRDPDVCAQWDAQPPESWEGDFPISGELYDVTLWDTSSDEPECIGSLGQVNVASREDPYCAVVEAELYLEAPLRGDVEQLEREAWAALDVETVR